jgi:hypothetical protein
MIPKKINSKGYEMKRSWPNFEVLSQHLLVGLRKTSYRIAGLWAKISK